jgi:hypothetical protein
VTLPLLSLAIVLLLGLIAGYASFCKIVGDKIGSLLNKEVRSRVATAFIGAGIFGFVLMIPWINDVLLIFANSLGLGAVVLSRFGTKV